MATRENVPQNFKLEGSAAQLRCLMETIGEALKRAAQSTKSVAAQGNIGPSTSKCGSAILRPYWQFVLTVERKRRCFWMAGLKT